MNPRGTSTWNMGKQKVEVLSPVMPQMGSFIFLKVASFFNCRLFLEVKISGFLGILVSLVLATRIWSLPRIWCPEFVGSRSLQRSNQLLHLGPWIYLPNAIHYQVSHAICFINFSFWCGPSDASQGRDSFAFGIIDSLVLFRSESTEFLFFSQGIYSA